MAVATSPQTRSDLSGTPCRPQKLPWPKSFGGKPVYRSQCVIFSIETDAFAYRRHARREIVVVFFDRRDWMEGVE
ncbi:hypothetical protein [Mycobacterium stomatepiae]|uniref:hypothetical protein n=1 Tax=Mycobacterium stomatepiae TaxID=470076 RepID=UPI0013D39356|nr:hypothetical protein [Mycobacterium stomatepiae]MCV7167652.1 hypothetical protein [Mycobacterium stomatepiae]